MKTCAKARDHLLYLSGLIVLFRNIFNHAVKRVAKKAVIAYIKGYTQVISFAFFKKKYIDIRITIDQTNQDIMLHIAANQTCIISILGGHRSSSLDFSSFLSSTIFQ